VLIQLLPHLAGNGNQQALGQVQKLFCFKAQSGSALRKARFSDFDPEQRFAATLVYRRLCFNPVIGDGVIQ